MGWRLRRGDSWKDLPLLGKLCDSERLLVRGAAPSSIPPYTPELPDPNVPSNLKPAPGTLRVRCRTRGALEATQSNRNSRSKSISMSSMIGSKPSAVTFRVRTYRTAPFASRVKTSVPVSLA
jgi:hypothetical protein